MNINSKEMVGDATKLLYYLPQGKDIQKKKDSVPGLNPEELHIEDHNAQAS